MPSHKLSKYRDGIVMVEYCSLCSAEGENLAESCPGRFVTDEKKSKDVDKTVDKSKEQS